MSAAPSLPSLASPSDLLLLSTTSTHEKLLLAQAVFARGNGDFESVAEMIRGEVLLRRREEREEGWFGAERLRETYEAMCREAGYDANVERAAQSPDLRKIAHKFYMDRVHELYAGMQECQDQFRITYSELQELKEGKLDWRLTEPGRVRPPGTGMSPEMGKVGGELPA
ncbi:hypothetical protein JCM8547_002964 [Rhodosporidiobolus lusitaniae]